MPVPVCWPRVLSLGVLPALGALRMGTCELSACARRSRALLVLSSPLGTSPDPLSLSPCPSVPLPTRTDSWSSSTCMMKMVTSPTALSAVRARSCCSAAMPAAAGGSQPCSPSVTPGESQGSRVLCGSPFGYHSTPSTTSPSPARPDCTWISPREAGRSFSCCWVSSLCWQPSAPGCHVGKCPGRWGGHCGAWLG